MKAWFTNALNELIKFFKKLFKKLKGLIMFGARDYYSYHDFEEVLRMERYQPNPMFIPKRAMVVKNKRRKKRGKR